MAETLEELAPVLIDTEESKTILYIDVDDTILADCFGNDQMNLRPGVVTQISVLSRLFDCKWLTHWSSEDLREMWFLLFASRLEHNIGYANWRTVSKTDKASYVLSQSSNFYWLEDPLSTGDLSELEAAGLMDRYIPVNPKGLWSFTRSLRTLFDRAGISEADLKKVGAKPAWFNEPLGDHFDWHFYENPR